MERRRHLAPALVLGVLAVQVALAAPAHAAVQRYATPTGSGTACTTTAPCTLATAFNGAGSGAEVIIAPGTYDMGSTSLSRLDTVTGLNVHGVLGAPRPVINTSADTGVVLKGSGDRIADVTINHTGALFGLDVFSTGIVVERVDVHSSAPVACGLGYAGLVRDSLCANTAPSGGVAVDDSWGGGTGDLVLRNVTAVVGGAGSYGIRADATSASTTLTINARNVIAFGAVDVRSTQTGTNSHSAVTMANSNYDKVEEAGGGDVTNPGTVSNQTALPIFTDMMFHEAANSPTVDKGAVDSSVGTADLDGDPRRYGAAVDIGVDEWTPDVTPPDLAFDHTPKAHTHKRKAIFTFHASEPVQVTCALDKKTAKPCGSPFKLKHLGYGKHRLTVTATDAAGNVDPTPAVFTWKVKAKGKGGAHHSHHGHHHTGHHGHHHTGHHGHHHHGHHH